jgi:nucleotide-binding universal stress UspA family protein
MKTILAPIDFSAVTPWVVAEAADLARTLNGRLVLLNVTRPESIKADQESFRNTLEFLIEHPLMPGTGDKTGSPSKGPVSGDSLQLIGDAAATILEIVKTLNADYIVMGSHGRSALHDLVFGSVAAAVLKKARCPVVVVPSRTCVRFRKNRSRQAAVRSSELPCDIADDYKAASVDGGYP